MNERDSQYVNTAPLREALETRAQLDAGYRVFERELEQRLGPDWWRLPVDDIKRVTSEMATSRGEPKNAAGLAEAVEGMILTKLIFSGLETAMPGLKRPFPREVFERVFMQVVDERYGRMTDFAAEFAQRNLGVAF